MPEKELARSRLARSEVLGFRHLLSKEGYEREKELAIARIQRQFQPDAEKAAKALDEMVELLQLSRLTINLKCFDWFYNSNKSTSYTNYHQRGTTGGSTNIKDRDLAEMGLGQYGRKWESTNKGELEARQRIEKYGLLSSPSFAKGMRPRYAAVDYGDFTFGAASPYGESYFVLAEHMKHNASYCHLDSFLVDRDMANRKSRYDNRVLTLGEVTATFLTLAKIVLYSTDEVFRELYAYGTGQKKQGMVHKGLEDGDTYIEAHLHSDVFFNRDVDYLCISRPELLKGPPVHPKSHRKWPNNKTCWDHRDQSRVKKNVDEFALKNGFSLRYVG